MKNLFMRFDHFGIWSLIRSYNIIYEEEFDELFKEIISDSPYFAVWLILHKKDNQISNLLTAKSLILENIINSYNIDMPKFLSTTSKLTNINSMSKPYNSLPFVNRL